MISSDTKFEKMTSLEMRSTVVLSALYFMRMMGFFMILPVFSLYAQHLEGTTPALIGLAIGAYGLTQAILGIPFGWMSDRIGRRPVLVFGLIIFAMGSIVAANADSIAGVILGRVIQGAGAIASVIMAFAADLIREEHRTKSMAAIGMSIGAAFMLAMVTGPIVAHWVGVRGIFWLTAGFALGGIGLLFLLPGKVATRVHRDAGAIPAQLGEVLRNPELLRLNFGIFSLHVNVTAFFVVMPLVLRDHVGIPASSHWEVYFPVMLLSVLAMVPFVIQAEKHRRMKIVFVGAIILLSIAQACFAIFYDNFYIVMFLLLLFFTAFNLLEATLPSLVAKIAPISSKGTAMGMYSTSQFLGAALGGTMGGWLYGAFGLLGVFLACAMVAFVWGMVALTMQNPRYLATQLIRLRPDCMGDIGHLVLKLTQVRGVAEAVVIAEEGVAYLKVDRKALDVDALSEFSATL